MAEHSSARGNALDFATHSVFEGEKVSSGYNGSTSDEAQAEILATIAELRESFGPEALSRAFAAVPELSAAQGDPTQRLLQFARGFAVLVMESDRPKLVAAIVGRLARLDVATGRNLEFAALGRLHGISKQAVCNKSKLYSERLNLPRLDSQPSARASSRLMNRRNYGAARPLPSDARDT